MRLCSRFGYGIGSDFVSLGIEIVDDLDCNRTQSDNFFPKFEKFHQKVFSKENWKIEPIWKNFLSKIWKFSYKTPRPTPKKEIPRPLGEFFYSHRNVSQRSSERTPLRWIWRSSNISISLHRFSTQQLKNRVNVNPSK